jgi:hypothetical protein
MCFIRTFHFARDETEMLGRGQSKGERKGGKRLLTNCNG